MARSSTSGQGRRKGVKNKKTVEMQEKVARGGISPLDYMLDVMRDPAAEKPRRDDMARAAAPYVHPKLAQVELGNKDGAPFVIQATKTDEGLV